MRVLLIEDDSAVAQAIELMLKSESFNVYTTDLGEEGVDLGKLYDYDIILLDLNLPDMSGYDVLKQLRVSKIKTPILILSGLAGIEDKVKGLGVGADDYMTKPFHKDALVARIHAIVRRSKGHAQSPIQTGDLVLNLDTQTLPDVLMVCSPNTASRRILGGFCFWGLNRRRSCGARTVVPSWRETNRTPDMILQSLAGLPAFLVYFCTALVAVIAYLFVYTRITPHDEFKLIRENDPAAAIALGLSLLGFVLPVVSALAHAANVCDCLIWSAVALMVQIVVYYIVKIPVPNLSARIAAGELAAAIWLGLSSLAAGALNAACMIY